MAGSTTNIGLIKPTYSEDADVAIINENMDTLDSTISALDNGLAIVSNNNTHGAITAGQYVYVRNHGSLAEGMYTANSNIAANATLSSSNLTAVTGGGLNDLAGDISALNSKFADLGSFNGSTDTEFITNVLSAISSYPNGTTYVFCARWQNVSAYVIVAYKVLDTRIIGTATPQIQNGKDVFGFSLEGTTVNVFPIALQKDTPKYISVGINAGSSYSLDIEDGKAYQITLMTSSNTSQQTFVITRRNAEIQKAVLFAGSYSSYFSDSINNNKWTVTISTYYTILNIIIY